MKHGTTAQTAIISVAAVIAVALLCVPFETGSMGQPNNSVGLVWIAFAAAIAVVVVQGFRYLTTRKRAQLELESSEQYRRLAEEYRRLADLAITAQEHTDLKLGDVSARIDYLRDQMESLQKILKEVE
jgi:beta-lactamase regulating signal transducer with metallopeptidase domain